MLKLRHRVMLVISLYLNKPQPRTPVASPLSASQQPLSLPLSRHHPLKQSLLSLLLLMEQPRRPRSNPKRKSSVPPNLIRKIRTLLQPVVPVLVLRKCTKRRRHRRPPPRVRHL